MINTTCSFYSNTWSRVAVTPRRPPLANALFPAFATPIHPSPSVRTLISVPGGFVFLKPEVHSADPSGPSQADSGCPPQKSRTGLRPLSALPPMPVPTGGTGRKAAGSTNPHHAAGRQVIAEAEHGNALNGPRAGTQPKGNEYLSVGEGLVDPASDHAMTSLALPLFSH